MLTQKALYKYLLKKNKYGLISTLIMFPPLRLQDFGFLLLFSCLVMSDSLRPHGLQHARLSCPSPSPGACSNSCPLSR